MDFTRALTAVCPSEADSSTAAPARDAEYPSTSEHYIYDGVRR